MTKHGLISTFRVSYTDGLSDDVKAWRSRCLCGYETPSFASRFVANETLYIHVRQETE